LLASCSVIKPLITSVSPSGHRISIPQPVPGFFRAMKVGRCSNIRGICAHDGPVQASYPATIKLPSTQGAVVGRLYLASGLTRIGLPLPWVAVAARGNKGSRCKSKQGARRVAWLPVGVWESVTSFSQKPAISPAWPSNRRSHRGRTMRGPRPGKSRI
jgi:hypothetical protein